MNPIELVRNGTWIRVRDGAGGHTVLAVGKVISYCEHATLVVESADGTRSSWSVALPHDIIDPPPPPEPPAGSLVHLTAYGAVYVRRDDGYWYDPNLIGARPVPWALLITLNSGEQPVRLVPATGDDQ